MEDPSDFQRYYAALREVSHSVLTQFLIKNVEGGHQGVMLLSLLIGSKVNIATGNILPDSLTNGDLVDGVVSRNKKSKEVQH